MRFIYIYIYIIFLLISKHSVSGSRNFIQRFIKKYKLKQNLIKIKLDYIELPIKKNTQIHKILQFLSMNFHILNHYKPSIFPKN